MANSARLALLMAAMLLGGCAGDFAAKWKAAPRAPADGLAGRWAGSWRSTRSGHQGALECVFKKTAPQRYRADFHAHWHGLSGVYAVDFRTQQEERRVRFEGEHDLGVPFGGVYRYQGAAENGQFKATYRCRSDEGVFQMKRAISD